MTPDPTRLDAEEAAMLTRWTGCPYQPEPDEPTDTPCVIDDALAEHQIAELLQPDIGGSD